jgi:hypothetical protein
LDTRKDLGSPLRTDLGDIFLEFPRPTDTMGVPFTPEFVCAVRGCDPFVLPNNRDMLCKCLELFVIEISGLLFPPATCLRDLELLFAS